MDHKINKTVGTVGRLAQIQNKHPFDLGRNVQHLNFSYLLGRIEIQSFPKTT